MISDFHVHTDLSADSKADMEKYILHAIEKKMYGICFTEHVDLNENDDGFNFYDPKRYFEKLNGLKEKYGNQIHLYAGIEFGEPHVYTDDFKQLSALPYDFIIGSVHWMGDLFPGEAVKKNYSAKDFYTLYWKNMMEMVIHGGFDCMGHVDFPKRYYGEIYYSETQIKELFDLLLDKDMVIEINTSSLRKGLAETMPGKEILEIYKDRGGKYVTIGSDSHFVEDIGADNESAKKLIKDLGLQEVIYEQRQRIIV